MKTKLAMGNQTQTAIMLLLQQSFLQVSRQDKREMYLCQWLGLLLAKHHTSPIVNETKSLYVKQHCIFLPDLMSH